MTAHASVNDQIRYYNSTPVRDLGPEVDWDREKLHGKPIWRREDWRIGVLIDTAMATPPVDHFKRALRLAFDHCYDTGVIPRPVELVVRDVNGLPFGRFAEVREAWRQLVEDEGVLGVAGPWLSENALALIDDVEASRVPSLSMAVVGPWCGHSRFAYQNGDSPQDTWLLGRYMKQQGWNTVAIMHEHNNMGIEYNEYFEHHARRLGLKVVSNQPVHAGIGDGLRTLYQNVLDAKPDCFAYFGYGLEGALFMRLGREMLEGKVPRLMGANFLGASTPEYGYGYSLADIEGWVGIEQYDPRNPATIEFLDRYEARWGERPAHSFSTQGWDFGITFAEALSMMRPSTPEALRDALEEVKLLPAVTGSAGTMISFAPYDHRAYKGNDFVSMSKCENGIVTKIDL